MVISTFDRSAFLGALLDALVAQTMDSSCFEVVFVDNGSHDDTWEKVKAETSRTPLRMLGMRLEVNSGAGSGRNAGIEASRAPVIAFTDDDCVPTPGWLEALTRPLLASGLDERPELVIQGRTHPWPADAEGAGAWARTVWVLRPTWLFETCNIAYRRTDLGHAGGFLHGDDAPKAATRRAFGEDAELGWRVVSSGAELLFTPEAVVEHRHIAASYTDWLIEQCRRGDFPGLVARHTLGRKALWHRWFLASRTAAFDVGVICGLVGILTRRSRWLVGWAPWLWLALPEASQRGGRHPAIRLAQIGLGDLVGMSSLLAGSARARSVVL